MTRRRKFLLALLIPTIAVAVWQWFLLPYEWSPDPAAEARVEFASIRRDRDYHWLDLKLKMLDPTGFRLDKELALVTAEGRKKKPDGLTFEGSGRGEAGPESHGLAKVEGLALKFWMEPGDFSGPLTLRINGGELQIRTRSGAPELEDGESMIKRNTRW